MAKEKIRFTNFWGDEISKQQYVDDKIRVLSEMELFLLTASSMRKNELRISGISVIGYAGF